MDNQSHSMHLESSTIIRLVSIPSLLDLNRLNHMHFQIIMIMTSLTNITVPLLYISFKAEMECMGLRRRVMRTHMLMFVEAT